MSNRMNPANNAMEFQEWVDIYLENYVYPVCKPSSAAYFADNLRKHAVPQLGDIPLAAIDSAMLQQFLNQQAAHGRLTDGGPLSPKSIRNLRTALSACFTTAVAQGVLQKNPVPGTVIRRSRKPVVETMEEQEREKLLRFLYQDQNLMNVGIILAAEMGMRRGEICALRWQDYDPQRGYLQIRNTVKRLPNGESEGPKTVLVFGPTKSEAGVRSLALSPSLCQLLDRHGERFAVKFGRQPEFEDFIVYSSVGSVTDPDHLTHYFADVLAGLGLNHVKFHALRHTFATRAVEQGIDIESISGILGHTDVTTTTHYYLHPRQNGMNQALWKLAGAPGMPPSQLPLGFRSPRKHHTFTRRSSFGEGVQEA